MRLAPKARDTVAGCGLVFHWERSPRVWGVAMRLHWIAMTFVLGFIIVLDPTHTPAQPGFGKKGDRGDREGKGGGKFGGGSTFPSPGGGSGFPGGSTFPGGSGSTFPGGGSGFPGGGRDFNRSGGTFPAPAAPAPVVGGVTAYGASIPQSGGTFPQPGGGFPGGGGTFPQPGGGFPGGGFPGGGGGFPGGGGGGGGRGGPELGWTMLVRSTGSNGDTIDLSKIDARSREFMKMRADRDGTAMLPESGIMTKDQYMDYYAKNEAARAARSGGMPGAPGAPMMVSL